MLLGAVSGQVAPLPTDAKSSASLTTAIDAMVTSLSDLWASDESYMQALKSIFTQRGTWALLAAACSKTHLGYEPDFSIALARARTWLIDHATQLDADPEQAAVEPDFVDTWFRVVFSPPLAEDELVRRLADSFDVAAAIRELERFDIPTDLPALIAAIDGAAQGMQRSHAKNR